MLVHKLFYGLPTENERAVHKSEARAFSAFSMNTKNEKKKTTHISMRYKSQVAHKSSVSVHREFMS